MSIRGFCQEMIWRGGNKLKRQWDNIDQHPWHSHLCYQWRLGSLLCAVNPDILSRQMMLHRWSLDEWHWVIRKGAKPDSKLLIPCPRAAHICKIIRPQNYNAFCAHGKISVSGLAFCVASKFWGCYCQNNNCDVHLKTWGCKTRLSCIFLHHQCCQIQCQLLFGVPRDKNLAMLTGKHINCDVTQKERLVPFSWSEWTSRWVLGQAGIFKM